MANGKLTAHSVVASSSLTHLPIINHIHSPALVVELVSCSSNNDDSNFVYITLLQIGFVMYLLYRMLGISAIIGSMVCIIIMIPLQFVIGKKMSNNAELSAVRPMLHT